MTGLLLAIDQGTTSSRAILFDTDGTSVAKAQREFTQLFPKDGWVEHDPEEIWITTLTVCREVLRRAESGADSVATIGITNQRETVIVWDRDTGLPVHNAIVWQDRRTADDCRKLKEAGHEAKVTALTGLVLDPYFSATKIVWILDNVEGARARAEQGALAFGTVDSFLLWRLTGGRVHATDTTNAARTLLFDIHAGAWSEDLLNLFRVPAAMLPEVRASADDFGETDSELFGCAVPIRGVAGDQQAATVGQACFNAGMVKCTYGTGAFLMQNTGRQAVPSRNKLLCTSAYRTGDVTTYALEGSIFVAGAAVQWLRDAMGIVRRAEDTELLAAELDSSERVYLVPAFVGLGAPYWDPDARGAIMGLTRDTGPRHIARAALEAVGYQTRDLLEAMAEDGVPRPQTLRVDGGMAANDWLLQFLADILDLPVERPAEVETTALGAAYLAGLGAGVFGSLDELTAGWRRDRVFEPTMPENMREELFDGWRNAVSRVLGYQKPGTEMDGEA